MINYLSGIAKEDLNNYSVCVLEDNNYIRRIKDADDMNKRLVFVNNIVPYYIDEEYYFIKENDNVRFSNICIMFISCECK